MESLDKLQKMKDLLKLVDESISRKEFISSFKAVLDYVKQAESDLSKKIDTKIGARLTDAENELGKITALAEEAKNSLDQIVTDAQKANDVTIASLKKRAYEAIDALFARVRINERFEEIIGTHEKQYNTLVQELNDKILNIPDIDEDTVARDAAQIVEKQYKKDLATELRAENIRDKLQSLNGDERLDKSAIKGLDEELKKMKEYMMTARGTISGGAGRTVTIPMVDDFSDQTDGSTKTFYLAKAPRNLNTIKVWGSDFPHILRATVDFTVTGKLLTLTSEVDAPSSGATLICEYYV